MFSIVSNTSSLFICYRLPYNYIYFLSSDVVRAYKNLLQEKEALEASINVLTTSHNQSTKSSPKKEVADGKDQNESAENEKSSNSASKCEGATSSSQEEGTQKEEVLDHPLAIKDAVEHEKESKEDKV